MKLKGEDEKADILRQKYEAPFTVHPDKANIKPIGLPVILLGSKYDIFQDMDMYALLILF